MLDVVPVGRIVEAETRIRSEARHRLPDILASIAEGGTLADREQAELRRVAEEAVLDLVEEESDGFRP